jgi:hypothetical protein
MHVPPKCLVSHTILVELKRGIQLCLSPYINNVYVKSWGRPSAVNKMPGDAAKSDQSFLIENRRNNAYVG